MDEQTVVLRIVDSKTKIKITPRQSKVKQAMRKVISFPQKRLVEPS